MKFSIFYQRYRNWLFAGVLSCLSLQSAIAVMAPKDDAALEKSPFVATGVVKSIASGYGDDKKCGAAFIVSIELIRDDVSPVKVEKITGQGYYFERNCVGFAPVGLTGVAGLTNLKVGDRIKVYADTERPRELSRFDKLKLAQAKQADQTLQPPIRIIAPNGLKLLKALTPPESQRP